MLAAFFTTNLALTLNVPTPPPLVQPAPQQRSLATTVLLADGVPEQSLLFPTTGAIADGKLLKETKNGDVYSGELDLGDMLDTIPTSDLDLNGEKGMKRDAQGIQRLKARTAIQEKRAFNKYLEVMEEEAAQDAAPSFFK